MSNKQKREDLVARRMARTKKKGEKTLICGLKKGTIVRSDPSKVFSRSVLPKIPEFYSDIEFECRDCGVVECWTAKMQKRYYEEQHGEIEGLPIRCNACRKNERARSKEVRHLHMEGIRKKAKSVNGTGDPS